jgi:Trk-type K+ transport system membrane component
MTANPLLFLLLLGHVIGGFYMPAAKSPLRHGLCYALVMAAVLFPMLRFSPALVLVFTAVCLSHFAIGRLVRLIKYKPFIVGQGLHIAAILLLWLTFNSSTEMWPHAAELYDYVLPRVAALSESPYWTLLGVLVILRPVGHLIRSNEIWDFGSSKASPNAGRMIGYLERLIVFFLILNGALGTIGFVIAAKAAIRFPEIISEKNEDQKRNQVEYFLIGTLLSMVCVFTVYLLLGVAA